MASPIKRFPTIYAKTVSRLLRKSTQTIAYVT